MKRLALASLVLLGLLAATAAASPVSILTENFSNLAASGWTIVNNSTAGGLTPVGFYQGTAVFTAYQGAASSYAEANYNNAAGGGDISTWLISPELVLRNGMSFSFWTIGEDVAGYPDRLEVRLSTSGSSTGVGSTTTSVGDFSNLLLSVNPTLADAGYPTSWSREAITLSGLSSATTGRIALRYFVTDTRINAATIGIDSVNYVPEPASWLLIGSGVALCALLRRRQAR